MRRRPNAFGLKPRPASEAKSAYVLNSGARRSPSFAGGFARYTPP
jgi:hypothetical protein